MQYKNDVTKEMHKLLTFNAEQFSFSIAAGRNRPEVKSSRPPK
jgi:hypothetical protein